MKASDASRAGGDLPPRAASAQCGLMADRRYLVKEMFGPTLQGEGTHAGRPCVFLRFAVCNLACTWCDTDFDPKGATRMTAPEIVSELLRLDLHGSRCVIVTGGEPTLQWDAELADAVRSEGFRSHMESNGTRVLQAPVDWLTFSPKSQFHDGETFALRGANECKVVIDDTVTDDVLAGYEALACDAWFLQPCMDAEHERHLARAIDFVTRRPRWRLSVQLHKILGLP